MTTRSLTVVGATGAGVVEMEGVGWAVVVVMVACIAAAIKHH
jgi:hypothetical protein